MVMLMFHGAVFVTMACTFIPVKTTCLVLKTVFIQQVLKGHKYLRMNKSYQWLSESGTKWAVVLLHTGIVISDFYC